MAWAPPLLPRDGFPLILVDSLESAAVLRFTFWPLPLPSSTSLLALSFPKPSLFSYTARYRSWRSGPSLWPGRPIQGPFLWEPGRWSRFPEPLRENCPLPNKPGNGVSEGARNATTITSRIGPTMTPSPVDALSSLIISGEYVSSRWHVMNGHFMEWKR